MGAATGRRYCRRVKPLPAAEHGGARRGRRQNWKQAASEPLDASQTAFGVGSLDHLWAKSGVVTEALMPEDEWMQPTGHVYDVIGVVDKGTN